MAPSKNPGAASGKAARVGGKPSVKAKNLQFYKKTTRNLLYLKPSLMALQNPRGRNQCVNGAGAASGKAARAGGKPSVKAKNLQFYKKTTQKSKSHAGTSRKAQADISNSGKHPHVPDLMKNNKMLMKPSESPSPSEIAADFRDHHHSKCICRQQLSGRGSGRGRGRLSEDDDVLFKSLLDI